MDNTYLAHYGVLGMKWGVRRYQNKDGTRTRLGRKHREEYEPKHMAKSDKSIFKQDIKGGKDKPNQSLAEKAIKDTKNATEGTADLIRAIERLKANNRPKSDLSGLSDKELQDTINRLTLEKRYRDLTEPEVSKGASKALQIIDIAGDAMSVAASAAGVAAAVYTFTHK